MTMEAGAAEGTELEPCPFCGNPDVEYDIICIDCHNCHASGPARRAGGDDGVLTSEAQWNKRRPDLARENIALREAMGRILRLRPAGDIDTAKNTRSLVEQMERIAANALEDKHGK
jgi:hypothetical protein